MTETTAANFVIHDDKPLAIKILCWFYKAFIH